MPRLFAALELPQMARQHLALMRGEVDGAHWIAAENMHITLRFFGDVAPTIAHEIDDALVRIEARAFTLEIRGANAFGSGSPTSLYAAVTPSEPLYALQRAIDRVARQTGCPPDGREFVPHVTLARIRHGRARQIAQFLEDAGHLRLPPIEISHFTLMSSRPGTGGGPYGIEATYDLA